MIIILIILEKPETNIITIIIIMIIIITTIIITIIIIRSDSLGQIISFFGGKNHNFEPVMVNHFLPWVIGHGFHSIVIYFDWETTA